MAADEAHPGLVVRKYRRKRGMTQAQLAAQVDCSEAHVWRLEVGQQHYRGTRNLDRLLQMFRVLEIPAAEQSKALGLPG